MRLSSAAPARALLGAFAIAGSIAAAAPPAEAQVHLQGRVLSEGTELPIAGARVALTDVRGKQLDVRTTDENGSFSFLVKRSGAVRLSAERMGFERTLTPRLHFDQYDYFNVEIRLDERAVLLAPLEVRARSASRGSMVLAAFEQRRSSSPAGVFFTQLDIEERRPGYVTDLLGTIPGVRLVSNGPGSRRQVLMTRATGQNCIAHVYVDGSLMNRDREFSIDDAVSPAAIHGIEVYRGSSTVPADFLGTGAACGVVVIWTKRTNA